ncbi:MAG: hypothetical protein ABL962_18180, partial [Fimbriimonadaceae bacterium]
GGWGSGAAGFTGARGQFGVKRLCLAIGLVTCLGCGSLSTIFVRNESDGPIDVKVTYVDSGRTKRWSGIVDRGDRQEVVKFYDQAPEKLWINVNGASFYLPYDALPPAVRNTGSSGDPFDWVFDGKSGRFVSAGLGPSDMMIRNLFAVIVTCITGGIVSLIYLVRKRSQRGNPSSIDRGAPLGDRGDVRSH